MVLVGFVGGFGWFWLVLSVVLGSFGWFRVLVTTSHRGGSLVAISCPAFDTTSKQTNSP